MVCMVPRKFPNGTCPPPTQKFHIPSNDILLWNKTQHNDDNVKKNIMGGHAAWRKRVERGQLAKQSSGAICRHRPHLGAKGKERGNRAGGNPKKKKGKQQHKEKSDAAEHSCPQQEKGMGSVAPGVLVPLFLAVIGVFVIGFSMMTGAPSR